MMRLAMLCCSLVLPAALACAGAKPDSLNQQPELLSSITVTYPETALAAKAEGTVYVRVAIDEKGKVIKVSVAKGVHASLDSAALAATRDLRFSPARHDGSAVKSEVTIPIRFVLDRAEKKKK